MEKKVCYSISEINEYIKILFDNTLTLKGVNLKGEISNYKGRNKSGHIYFTLKDEKSSINAVLFKYDSFGLDFEPKNGDEVIVYGSITSYPPSGSYQIICKKISRNGIGDAFLKKEILKKKLFQEGLFNNEHKKEIPKYPLNIGIITGKNSAAAADLEFNLERRFPIITIKHYYSLVQGESAPDDLIKNLLEADKDNNDLIIIGRGGGASEDLGAFDDENLVRSIYNLKTPIISAVGHEINQTLCDLVADKYASTPTGAAEIAVPNIEDIFYDLNQTKNYLDTLINSKIAYLENRLLICKNKKYFQNIENIYDNYFDKLKSLSQILNIKLNKYIDQQSKQINFLKKSLELVNPNNLLSKGYSIITNKENKVIYSLKDIAVNEEFNLKMNDGQLKAKVIEKEK